MHGRKRQRTGEVGFENVALMNYFKNEVQVSRKKTKIIIDEVLPKIKDLVKDVSSNCDHFDAEPVAVGSYTQGLGVDSNRDYDFNIVFRYNPGVGSSRSNTIEWCLDRSPLNYGFIRSPLNYGFHSRLEKTVSIFDPDVKVVHTLYSLPEPSTGYLVVHANDVPDFTFDGVLIPFYVQREFALLLLNAIQYTNLIQRMNPNGIFELSKKLHGPALKVKTEIRTDDGVKHEVSIDLAVIIRAQMPFLPKAMGWPVPGAQWPSRDKIQAIMEKGINLVAKKEFFWQLSFAELEKLLVDEIDKDGGCRKTVHRIMKSVFYAVCGDKSNLSTYILKNVWFHECEEFHSSNQWASDRLGERYKSCLKRLVDCSKNRVLLQYFNRRVNLLEEKDISSDVEKICLFDFSQRQT